MTNATIPPTIEALAIGLRAAYASDAAAVRGVDRAVDHLASGLPFEFDGVELRITSFSRRSEGAFQVTNGEACTCESYRRPWCWHRIAYRLLMADLALRSPGYLRAKIVEQVSQADIQDDYDDMGDFLAQSARVIRPGDSRFARSQQAADMLFAA